MTKHILALLLMAALLFTTATAGYVPETDYMEEMIRAATEQDAERGRAAEEARNRKIDDLGMEYVKVSYDELVLLSKIIQAEAGSSWLTDEHQRLVGSVVLNRENSPEFPDTLEEVIYQKGQYYGTGTKWFAKLCPTERAVRNALYVLENGSIAPSSVVFQANFKQGSGTWLRITDKVLGSTYFCYSSRTELYEE